MAIRFKSMHGSPDALTEMRLITGITERVWL